MSDLEKEERHVLGHYIIPKNSMSEPAIKSFNNFLNLTEHGAKSIDIKVRQDGKEYEFQADFLKYTKEITI